jgi:hypothetical protein
MILFLVLGFVIDTIGLSSHERKVSIKVACYVLYNYLKKIPVVSRRANILTSERYRDLETLIVSLLKFYVGFRLDFLLHRIVNA